MSDVSSRYAPDEPEGAARSAYLSRKDLKRLGIGFLLLFALGIPVYRILLRQSEMHRCALNFKAMHEAMGLYSIDWNDRYPPVAVQDRSGAPLILAGKPVTWGSQLRRYLSQRANLQCPSAHPDELAHAQHPESSKLDVPMSYGLFIGMSAAPINLIANPGQAVVVSETSNFGTNNTFNPVPFVSEAGETIRIDGFVIGYNDGNLAPSVKTYAVTRLAFPDTKGGNFSPGANGRHGAKIHALYADGHLGYITAPDALVSRRGDTLVGRWAGQ